MCFLGYFIGTRQRRRKNTKTKWKMLIKRFFMLFFSFTFPLLIYRYLSILMLIISTFVHATFPPFSLASLKISISSYFSHPFSLPFKFLRLLRTFYWCRMCWCCWLSSQISLLVDFYNKLRPWQVINGHWHLC